MTNEECDGDCYNPYTGGYCEECERKIGELVDLFIKAQKEDNYAPETMPRM